MKSRLATTARPLRLLIFPKNMATSPQQPANEPLPRTNGWNPQRHGNLAQWVAPGISLLGALLSFGAVVYYHNLESSTKASDEHIKLLIANDPAVAGFNENIGKKLKPLNEKLDKVAAEVDDAEGQLKRMKEDISQQDRKQNGLLAAEKIDNPNRLIGIIRSEIQIAQDTKRPLASSNLVDYKDALQVLPTSTGQYWITVAEVINYQSLLNQLSGNAPDPKLVSHFCGGFTGGSGGYNLMQGGRLVNCILDLDTTYNILQGVLVKDSLVRYHGGEVRLSGVTFVNCFFVLDLPSPPKNPAHNDFLHALLESRDQRRVVLGS